jgi:hypothetical protein
VTKISKGKLRSKVNPFLDEEFNRNKFSDEKGLRPDDIAERTGIPTNEYIEVQTIEGMTFLKLDDTPSEYETSKYLRVNEDADAVIFDDLDIEVYWAKGSNCIYYKDQNVAIGKTTADYELDVSGTIRATTALLSDAHVTAGSYVQAGTYVKADSYVEATTYYKFGGNNLLWLEDDHNIILGEDCLGGDNLLGYNFNNCFIAGYQSAYHLETAISSEIIGYQAAYRAGGVHRSVIIGDQAGVIDASATNNDYDTVVIIGEDARYDGSGDLGGIYIGGDAGKFLAYGQGRICIGRGAGRGHGTSGYSSCNYDYGIFIGEQAGGGAVNITGNNNVGLGHDAMYSVTSSTYGIGVGYQALYSVTSGGGNIGIGRGAGDTLTTGQDNLLLGDNADVDNADYDNVIVIGHDAVGTASNQIVLGNTNHTELKIPFIGEGYLKTNSSGVITEYAMDNFLSDFMPNLIVHEGSVMIHEGEVVWVT